MSEKRKRSVEKDNSPDETSNKFYTKHASRTLKKKREDSDDAKWKIQTHRVGKADEKKPKSAIVESKKKGSGAGQMHLKQTRKKENLKPLDDSATSGVRQARLRVKKESFGETVGKETEIEPKSVDDKALAQQNRKMKLARVVLARVCASDSGAGQRHLIQKTKNDNNKPLDDDRTTIGVRQTRLRVKKEPFDETVCKETEIKAKNIDEKANTLAKTKTTMKAADVLANKYIGAHVSAAGGVHNAITEAHKIGAKAIGVFLRSQRQWNAKPLEQSVIEKFNVNCETYSFPKDMILPHGSYLLNLGSPEPETRKKSINLLVEELQRCDKLGIPLYNFHPGSTCKKITKEECIHHIADGINHAHKESSTVITVIENMSGQGGTIGGRFEELRDIIELVTDKSRVGVCLDTCHLFAAGYDIKYKDGYEDMKTQFEEIVGFKYLKAFHLNDSKGPCGSNLDRHENIGCGKLGLEPFKWIVNEQIFDNIPMVLETPGYEHYDRQIQKLYSLVKQ